MHHSIPNHILIRPPNDSWEKIRENCHMPKVYGIFSLWLLKLCEVSLWAEMPEMPEMPPIKGTF